MTMNKDKGKCDVCNGTGQITHGAVGECNFCNGTGEWNNAAQKFMDSHICQCFDYDRKNCPVCHKPCHHDTSLNPKQKIDPGYGGISFIDTTADDKEEIKTEDITA